MSLLDALRHHFRVLVRRDAYSRELADDVAQDIRYAARTFRRAPGFTIAAVVTLALGIGATTAIFSIIDGVLVRGLPYRDADRVVDIWETSDNGGYRLPSYPTFKDWRRQSQSWSDAFEEMAYVKGAAAIYVGDKGPEQLLASFVSPAIGMYGVIAYGVAQRTREMGVRMALGASDRRILGLILGEGVRLAAVGAVLGLAAAASTRLIRSLLFETTPADPMTFIVTPLVLAGVALLATYIPARRATRLDPTLAIRGD
jgi:FtsX-like permease family protein